MSSDFQGSITFAIMSAEVQAAREAIFGIWKAHHGLIQGVTDGTDLEDEINAATKLLPADMQCAGMAPPPEQGEKVSRRRRPGLKETVDLGKSGEFDDVLG